MYMLHYFRCVLTILSFGLVASSYALYTAPTGQTPASGSTAIVTSPRCGFTPQYNLDGWKFEISTDSTFATGVESYSQPYFYVYFEALAHNTKYFWRGRSYNNGDSSHWSTIASFTTTSNTELYSPSDGATTSGRLYMSCYRSTLENHEFHLDTSNTFSSPLARVFYVSDSSFDNSWVETYYDSLYFGVKYYFKARAYEGTDTAGWSGTRFVNSSTNYSNRSVTNSSQTTVGLKWSHRTGILKYCVQLDVDTTFNTSELLNLEMPMSVLTNTFTVSELDYNTKYYWRIQAINAVDTFEWSDYSSFTTSGVGWSQFTTGYTVNMEVDFVHLLYSKGFQIQMDTVADYSSGLLDTFIYRDTSRSSAYYDELPVRNLNYGTTYYFRGRLFHSKDSSDWRTRTVTTSPIGQLRYPYPADILEPGDSITFDTSGRNGNYFRIQLDTVSTYNSSVLFDTVVLSSAPLSSWIKPKVYFNKKHYWRIKIANEKDTSEWSDFQYARTFNTPDKPVLVYPYDNSKLTTVISPAFRWNALKNTTYRLQIDTSGTYNSAAFVDTLITDYTGELRLNNLYFNSTYHWRVRYENGSDYSPWSEPRTFKTATDVLDIKPDHMATDVYPNSLDWRSIDGTTGYIIQLDTSADLSTARQDTIMEAKAFFYSFYLAGIELDFDEDYFFTVSLFNESDTLHSEVYQFTTRSREAPVLVSPADESDDENFGVTFKWNAYTGANGYLLEYSENEDMSDSTAVYQTALSYTTNLAFGRKYYWRVRAMYNDLIVVSDYTEPWSFTTQESIAGPLLITPLDQAVDVALDTRMRWEKVPNAANYTVELSQSSDFLGVYRKTSVTNSYLFDELTNDVKYYWRARGNVNGIASSWSETRSFTTIADKSSAGQYDANGLQVYPSPFHTKLVITGAEQYILLSVRDVLGNDVHHFAREDSKAKHTLNLSHLPAGMYIIRFAKNGHVYSQRILKE